ncbi:hypothetical protein [Streptomyces coeruleorubidus]|uniref:hypothetical protein n=1 Tax=Streptomyces coeruleorubidus TaxID=116188 RepID=UPI001E5635D5|nr:hypothetical protein [Streptomyces coeruleorubidus]
MYERIAAHDPSGAAEAMVTHITEVRLVRHNAPGDPVCLHIGKRHRHHRVTGWPSGWRALPDPALRRRASGDVVA